MQRWRRQRQRCQRLLLVRKVWLLNASTISAVEHCLDVFPGVQQGFRVNRSGNEFQMAPPRVEVGGVRMVVDCRHRGIGAINRCPMIVEDEFVR
jgi:hypothetical protein